MKVEALMKCCRICGTEKIHESFNRDASYADGLRRECRECQHNHDKAYRSTENYKTRRRAYVRAYKKRPDRKAWRKAYNSTERGRRLAREAILRHESKYPNRKLARQMARNAIRAGILVRPSACELLGLIGHVQDHAGAIEAHHDDYSKPLEVRWLCKACHTRHSLEKLRIQQWETC